MDELLDKMTLEEKAALLTGATTWRTGEAEGLPPKYFADGPHGIRRETGEDSPLYPNLCCLGATWDAEAAYRVGEALAADCIEQGIDILLGPGANLKRTPLCGRNFEYFSEDPVVAGEMAAAYIRGLQSRGVGACLKHFAMNNQERNRCDVSVEVDLRVMRELYLRCFEIAVKKGKPYSIMCAYNRIHSLWCSENPYLLTEVLRQEWGYEGCLISDWGAVHDICRAVTAGLNLQMPANRNIREEIARGLEQGTVTMEAVDRAADRVLNLLRREKPAARETYDREKQHTVACQTAAEGIVLLKNREGALPLTPGKHRRIAVLGEYAQAPLVSGQGAAEVYSGRIDSPLEALRQRLGEDVEVRYLEAFQKSAFPIGMMWPEKNTWLETVKDCDAVIVFAGVMSSEDTEQFDRRTLELNPNYGYVIQAICQRHPNVIVVLQSGSAVILGDWQKDVAAIVHMWLGGEGAGSAIADVLTGRVNPSGRLTETFPNRMRTDLEYPGDGRKVRYHEGFDVGYRYYDRHPEEIAYPFGFGLSYTNFRYSDLALEVGPESVDLAFDLANTGEMDGSEVVQLYVGMAESSVTRPIKELKAFSKVFVRHGEKTRVRLQVPVQDLAYYNVMLHQWCVEPGEYTFMVAASSRDIRLTQSVRIDSGVPYTVGT